MKKLIASISATAFAFAAFNTAFAAPKYPDVKVPGTIRVIVSYNAGGSSDTLARVTLLLLEKSH